MRNPVGRGTSGRRWVHRGHGLAQRNLGIGADLDDALLVLAIDLAGPELRLNRHHVLDGQRDAAGGVDHHVVDVAHLLPVLFTQPDDDGILESALPELRGRRAGDVGPDRVGNRRGIEAEERGLRPVDLHGQLGTRFFAAEPRIRDARRGLQKVLDVLRDARAPPEIFTADLHRHASAAVVQPARHQLVDLVVSAAALARTMTPGMPASWRRSSNAI